MPRMILIECGIIIIIFGLVQNVNNATKYVIIRGNKNEMNSNERK
jgi:hypothetical protein